MAIVPALVRHDYHIHARRMYDRMGVQLYLWRRLEDGRMHVCTIEKQDDGTPYVMVRDVGKLDGAVLLDSIPDLKPFMVVDEPFYRELLSAMMRLGDEECIPRPSEDHLKGKLEATQKHLEDVQNMLKFTTQLIHRREKEGEHGPHRDPQGDGNSVNGLLEQAQ